MNPFGVPSVSQHPVDNVHRTIHVIVNAVIAFIDAGVLLGVAELSPRFGAELTVRILSIDVAVAVVVEAVITTRAERDLCARPSPGVDAERVVGVDHRHYRRCRSIVALNIPDEPSTSSSADCNPGPPHRPIRHRRPCRRCRRER